MLASTVLEEMDRKCCNGAIRSHLPGFVLKRACVVVLYFYFSVVSTLLLAPAFIS